MMGNEQDLLQQGFLCTPAPLPLCASASDPSADPISSGPGPLSLLCPESTPTPSSGRGHRGVQPRFFCYVDWTGTTGSEG